VRRLVCLAAIVGVLAVGCTHAEGEASSTQPPALVPTAQAIARPFSSTVILDAVTVPPLRVALERNDIVSDIEWRVLEGTVVAEGEVVAVEFGTDGGATLAALDREVKRAKRSLEYITESVSLDIDSTKYADRATKARASLDGDRAVEEATRDLEEAIQRRDHAADRTRNIESPIDGVVERTSDLGEKQIGWVVSAGLRVQARLEPLVRLRLPDPVVAPTVSIVGVIDKAECSAVRVKDADISDTDSRAVLECALPADIRVFAGLPAVISVKVVDLDNAVTVPIDAVRPIQPGLGEIVVVEPSGIRTSRRVELGPSDGITVVVTAGIEAGETVELVSPIEQPSG